MEDIKELAKDDKNISYKIAMLGDNAVGKSSLTYQFTTSEYICAYDLSLGEPFKNTHIHIMNKLLKLTDVKLHLITSFRTLAICIIDAFSYFPFSLSIHKINENLCR